MECRMYASTPPPCESLSRLTTEYPGMFSGEDGKVWLRNDSETKNTSSSSVWATTRYFDQKIPSEAVESANVGAL